MTMMAQLNVRVPEDLKRIVRYVTMMRGDSLSDVVREALENYLIESDEEIKALARHAAKKTK